METPFCDRCGLQMYKSIEGKWICKRRHAKKREKIGDYSGFSKSYEGWQKIRKDLTE